ncbi:MAG TPA: hypothetical protein VH724_08920 [Candidatus Angelobacter sp.]|jgi:hypothetical protein|nr:hypothetical protein [Candidatus Angelobacter sp.]
MSEIANGPFKVMVRTQEFNHSGSDIVDVCVANASSHEFPALADIYAGLFSTYQADTPMAGSEYPNTPQVNVTNITNGFNAQQGGYLCGS